MLESSTLASEVINGRYYSTGNVTSIDGRTIPIVSVYPKEVMETKAIETVRSVKLALPILEDFMATPFPRDVIRVWYGFRIGASG